MAHAVVVGPREFSLVLRQLATGDETELIAETDPIWPMFLLYCGITETLS